MYPAKISAESPAGGCWLNTWCTDTTGTTDAQSTFITCGFLGDYMIQVSAADKTKLFNVQLKMGGADVVVMLD